MTEDFTRISELFPGREEWLRDGGEDIRRLKAPGTGMTCGQLSMPNGTRFKVGHVWRYRGTVVANCSLPEAPYVRISKVPLEWLEPILEEA